MEYIKYYLSIDHYVGSNLPTHYNIQGILSWISSGNYVIYDNKRYDNSNIQELIRLINTVEK